MPPQGCQGRVEPEYQDLRLLLSPQEKALLDAADVLYDELGYCQCKEGRAYIKAKEEFLKTRQPRVCYVCGGDLGEDEFGPYDYKHKSGCHRDPTAPPKL